MRSSAGLVVALRLDCVRRLDCYPMEPAPDGVVSICRRTFSYVMSLGQEEKKKKRKSLCHQSFINQLFG